MSKPKSLGESLFAEMQQEEDQKQLPPAIIVPKLVLPQNIIIKKNDSEYLKSYLTIGMDQATNLFRIIFGSGYIKNNNLSFNQKQKILRYVFTKNNQLQDVIANYQRDSKKVKSSMYKQASDLEHLKNINRIQLVSGLAESRNRLGTMGYCWGAALSSLCYITILRKYSIWRRLAGFVTIFHISGQIVNYANFDRFADKLYPLFLEDLKVYNQEQAKKIESNETEHGQIKINTNETSLAEMRLDNFFEQKTIEFKEKQRIQNIKEGR